jgi:hypothetical protein
MPDAAHVSCAPSSIRPIRRRSPLAAGAFAPVALLCAAATLCATIAPAQTPQQAATAAGTVASQVVDSKGQPIAAATVRDLSGKLLGLTDASGRLTLPCAAPCQVVVEAPGFTSRKLVWQANAPVMLHVAPIPESVTVTAYRAPLGELESPASTRVLTGAMPA